MGIFAIHHEDNALTRTNCCSCISRMDLFKLLHYWCVGSSTVKEDQLKMYYHANHAIKPLKSKSGDWFREAMHAVRILLLRSMVMEEYYGNRSVCHGNK